MTVINPIQLPSSVVVATHRSAIAQIHGSRNGSYTAAGGFVETVERRMITMPVTTTQWRFRLSNYSAALEAGSLGAGTINLAGLYLGSPSLSNGPTLSNGAWDGSCAGAQTLLDSGEAMTLSGMGDMYVSPWITAANEQLQRGVPVALSLGCVGGSGSARLGYTNTGGTPVTKFWASGTGVSALASGSARVSAPTTLTMFDWRIEYMYDEPNLEPLPISNILFIGDSITEGNICNSSAYADLCRMEEAWPGAAALRNRFSSFNGGIASTTAYANSGNGPWDPTINSPSTYWRWQRTGIAPAGGYTNAPPTIPYDKAVIALGHNDISTATAAQVEASVINIANYLRGLGVYEIWVATIPPGNFGSATEAVRQALNLWVRSLPGIQGVLDFDKALALPATPVITTATLVSGAGGNPITVASATGIAVGQSVLVLGYTSATDIPAGTTVTGVSGTSITLSNNPTGSGAVTLMFSADNPFADPDLLFDYPHPVRAGYQRMAREVVLR